MARNLKASPKTYLLTQT